MFIFVEDRRDKRTPELCRGQLSLPSVYAPVFSVVGKAALSSGEREDQSCWKAPTVLK